MFTIDIRIYVNNRQVVVENTVIVVRNEVVFLIVLVVNKFVVIVVINLLYLWINSVKVNGINGNVVMNHWI